MKKGFLKKTIAAAVAGTMLISGASTAFAGAFADAFTEMIAKEHDEIVQSWDASMEQTAGEDSGVGTADIAVYLEDGGRSIVSMLTSLDLSWLERVGIKGDFNVDSEGVLQLYANEQTLANLLVKVDAENQIVKMMIPELSDSALTGSMSTDLNGDEDSEKAMRIYKDIMANWKDIAPDGETLMQLYDRYYGIILSYMQDGEIGEGTLSVDGIEEDCSIYEGIMDAKGAVEMAYELMETVKDDEQVAEIVKKLEASSPDLEGLYDQMQSGIAEILEEDKEEALNDVNGEEMNLSIKMYLNADGEAIGVAETVSADDQAMDFHYYQPSNDAQTGMELGFNYDDTSVMVSGSGSVKDDVANGVYSIIMDDYTYAVATVQDLDMKELKSGTIDIELAEELQEDLPFSVTLTFAETGLDIQVSLSGTPMGFIRITGGLSDAAVDVSALDAATTIYDSNNDDDVNAYMSEAAANIETILANLTAAGAPDGFAESLIALIAGSGSEDDYDSYEYDDDYADYEDGVEDTDSADEDAAA